ncbi:hypothetical protein BHM03_00030374 [Ensete ventricosum]|nr:hypothetical protein BHM03_00030374 [Ensete ventricosum]
MCSAQRLGWLSSSYGSTLATKLDGAQGKAGRLVKDETVQSGRGCVMTERVVQGSEVRGIANSKDSVLMQGLVHGRRSVRGHPKFNTLLDLEGCGGDCIGEGSQSSRLILHGAKVEGSFEAHASYLRDAFDGVIQLAEAKLGSGHLSTRQEVQEDAEAGVTQEWVDEGELPRERTKNRRWRRPYDVLAEATRGEVVVRVHHTRIYMQWRCHQEAWIVVGIVRGNAIQAILSVRDRIMRRYD